MGPGRIRDPANASGRSRARGPVRFFCRPAAGGKGGMRPREPLEAQPADGSATTSYGPQGCGKILLFKEDDQKCG